MDKRLVTETSSYIRSQARASLKGQWLLGTLATMLFYVLTVFIRNILNLIVDNAVDLPLVNGRFVTLTISGNLYDFLTTPIFTFGLMALVLVIARESKINLNLLFSGFEFYLKLLVLSIVMAIKIILWACLFIIPGIVAALNYSQAYYIFFDDPSKGVMQCINESIYLMRGNKANLFILCLSFIGWIILAGIIGSLPRPEMSAYLTQVYVMISYIPTAVVMIYYYVAQAKFHDLLYKSNVEGKTVMDPFTGEMIVQVEPVEVEEENEE